MQRGAAPAGRGQLDQPVRGQGGAGQVQRQRGGAALLLQALLEGGAAGGGERQDGEVRGGVRRVRRERRRGGGIREGGVGTLVAIVLPCRSENGRYRLGS